MNPTHYILIATAIGLCLYNVFALLWWGPDHTISYVMQDAAHRWPIFACLIGLLCGHWLWPVLRGDLP